MNTAVRAAVLEEAGQTSDASDNTGATAPGGVRRSRKGRAVGVLFLAAFVAYGVGSSLATSAATAGGSPAQLVGGVALVLVNSLIVIGIGVLMLPILKAHNVAIALAYLGTRIFEGLGLAVGGIALLAATGDLATGVNFIAYNVAMAGLGLGSIFFCVVLFRSGLAPPFLAVWGALGYATFASGSILELAGVSGAGLVGAVPGGLFELTFGIWLIVRGFRSEALAPNAAVTA